MQTNTTMRRSLGLCAASAILALSMTCPVHAQETELKQLNQKVAELYKQGDYKQATVIATQALELAEKTLGPDHPNVAGSLYNLAWMYNTKGQYTQALPYSRRATAIYHQRIVSGGTSDTALQEASQNRQGFFNHLSLLSRNPDNEPTANITDEAFQVVQLGQASGTAAAIAKMAGRFAKGDDALATLVKSKQDAAERIARQEGKLVVAAGKPPQQRNAADEQKLREDIVAAGKEVAALDAELTQRFPQYQELSRVEPLSVAQVRGLLKPGEAMLVYGLQGSNNFAWLVKTGGATFKPLTLDAKDVAAKVAQVRAQMEIDNQGKVPKVSVDALHELYKALLAPLEVELAGVNHLMLVPAGPLQSLPFGMLVATQPPTIETNADYRQVDWLAKRYALSVLPSVGSIQALRQFAQGTRGQEPFAGFGDPAIGEQSGGVRGGKTARVDIATVFRSLVMRTNDKMPTAGANTEIADVDMIRQASSLPESATELRAMAQALKADKKSIWLRDAATETQLKQLDLTKYRTLAFATHGVMAGEVKGVGEPGLILTPPKVGTLEDDGYLASGEIAKLKLNADWVILSACNTAAADGTPGAEGLSGMAKAFFYAGARSLLVSHWPVESDATVLLTTGTLNAYARNPQQGKAQAQSQAMLELMNTPAHPEYAHPLFWAPFVVVGEGG